MYMYAQVFHGFVIYCSFGYRQCYIKAQVFSPRFVLKYMSIICLRFSVRFSGIVCGKKLRCIRPPGAARTGALSLIGRIQMLTQCSKNMDMRRQCKRELLDATSMTRIPTTCLLLFEHVEKEMQTTDKTCILRKTFMSGPQNFILCAGV